jgi:hypothetical protein
MCNNELRDDDDATVRGVGLAVGWILIAAGVLLIWISTKVVDLNIHPGAIGLSAFGVFLVFLGFFIVAV